MENIQDIYPLSPMQEGMLFHSIYAPESEVYQEQFSCSLLGELNVKAFKLSWEKVLERHDILRTAFIWEDVDEPLQVLHKVVELPYNYVDCTDVCEEDKRKIVDEKLNENIKTPLDFSDAPLLRITLLRFSDDEHYLIWDYHHILFDGWGLPLLMQEFMGIYESVTSGKTLELSRPHSYKDFIAWLQEQDEVIAKEFWKDRLENFKIPTVLSIPQIEKLEEGYSREKKILSKDISSKVESLAKKEQLTINSILQGVWSLLLRYYTGDDDVVFGATVSGRNANVPGIESMIGLFINTLPVRAKINDDDNIVEWLKEFQLAQSELQTYEYSPLFKIQQWSEIPKGEALFNSIFVFENYPVSETLEESESELKITNVKSIEKTNYPLTIVIAPGKSLGIEIAYDTKLFSKQNIVDIQDRIELILQQITDDKTFKIDEIEYLFEYEKSNLIKICSGEKQSVPFNNIVSWFEHNSRENPEKLAVVSDKDKLTFNEVNNLSNQYARLLKEKGVESGSIVGIMINRSVEMVVLIMATLKAGASFVPIDIGYPDERINYIIDNSGMDLLITSSDINLSSDSNTKILSIDHIKSSVIDLSKENLNVTIADKDLCYIIYTSGSTGKPKGVCLEHAALCNFANYTVHDFGYSKNENILQFSSFGFDAAVGEIFSSLLSGNTLYIPLREATLSPEDLANYISTNKISFAYLPPSFLSVIDPNMFEDSLKIASVGDKCSLNLAKVWGENHAFFNGYGPTETTIGATYLKYSPDISNLNTMPIGKGFGNVEIYLLDKSLRPVAIGVKGEIFISGKGVGRGYLNNPSATADKFIPNPFSTEIGQVMYRSGDLARLLPDGNIEFIGRTDYQVKLRGYRIELNEIESVLSEYEFVKDCAVKAIKEKNGNEYLAGYIVLNAGETSINDVLNYLQSELPDYMVPKSLTFMDEFPLTPNRKVDKSKLPDPDENDLIEEFVELETTTEEIVANIWSDILKVEKVSRTSNFFELGGHSLLATQLISRLRETFKKEIPFQFVFESKNLQEVCKKIDEVKSDSGLDDARINRIDREGLIPLSYSQQRLWFLDKLKPGDASYNIPTILRLKGNINTDLFEEAFNAIISKHEILRTCFVEENGKPSQKIFDEFKLNIAISEVDGASIEEKLQKVKEEIIEESIIPFDLSELPLLRCKIFQLSEDEIILFVLAHHIISDGWSLSIMIREFVNNYSTLMRGEVLAPQNMKLQFADYAAWQQENFDSENYKQQLEYWVEQLNEAPPLLELPYDKPKPKIQSTNCGKVDTLIKKELVNSLLEVTRSENATLFMTMLAGFQLLLSKYSNQNDIVVGTPIAGRDNSQIENLVGFFVNNLAIRGQIDVKETFRDFLIQIRETTLSAYANQSLPFDKLVEEIQPTRDLSHQPVFQVMFVFQNIPTSNSGMSEIEIVPFKIESNTISYDLTLTLNQTEDGLDIIFDYNTDLFEEETITRFTEQYHLLLSQIARDPDMDIEDINVITEEERELVFDNWNLGEVKEKISENVVQRFEEIVNIHRNDEALVFDTMSEGTTPTRLTYEEFNMKANKVGRFLLSRKIALEDKVAICMDRNPNMIVSMLAILKTGAAFIPVDPALPSDRINYMLETAGCKTILCNDSTVGILNNLEYELFNLDKLEDELDQIEVDNLTVNITSENLAYIIYTSGSTGLPKGVMLHHEGLVNLSQVQREAFEISNKKKVMQFSSLSFDASVWETVMALLNGASLYLTTKEVISSGIDLHKYLLKHEITTITLPPSVLAVLPREELPMLKTLITAGEAVPNELVKEWNISRDYFNAYGPTETTVCATMLNVSEDYPKGPPIGNSINNFETYVLDAQLNEVGIGIPGELCVGGIGLARGYINQAELTADKFIPNKFSSKEGERLYRTGDLVKYLPDGKLEFLGRIDTQVKIRGFRIEVGEIENTIKQLSFINDAAVIAKNTGNLKDKIIAYIVCPEEEYNKEFIVEELRGKLPDYMLPNIFIRIESMPLNTSGKVNKKALPLPKYSREDIGAEYVAPRNEDEEKLVAIVEELLKIEKVGVKDSFFELGGHSLLATQFVSRIRDEFNVELKLLKLFEAPTIEGVLKNIKDANETPKIERPTISRVSRDSRRKRRTDLN